MSQFVQAGAGAGKTWNLTREVVGFALAHKNKHGEWPRVVLTTFTRKATQELKERLLIYCIQENEAALDFVQSTSYLSITTMHGLLSQFLSQKAFVFGLPTHFDIIDSVQVDYWRKKIVRDLIHQNNIPKSLTQLGLSRLMEALRSFEVVHWEGGTPPATVKDFEVAAQKSCIRLAKSLQAELDSIHFESMSEAWQKYAQSLKDIGQTLAADITWLQKRDQLLSLIDSLSRPRASKKNPGLDLENKNRLDKILSTTLKKSWLVEEQFNPTLWPQSESYLQDLNQLGQLYCELLLAKKIEQASLETDDLELLSLKLIRQYPEQAKDFAQQIQAWFIDEFQDTSPRQLQILEPLIADTYSYFVGDPQQSIYLFRGSRSEVFHQQKQKLEAKGADFTFLRTNYRSHANLLDFFNSYFSFLDSQFAPMDPRQPDPSAEPRVRITQSMCAEDREVELSHISQQLENLLVQGVSPKEICILARSHSDIELIQSRLMKLGFPVLSHASSQFYQRRETLDALSLLQVLLNPWDNKNLLIFLRSPWMNLSEQELVNVVSESKGHYWPLFAHYFKEQEHAQGLYLISAIQSVNEQGASAVLRQALIELGLFSYSYVLDPTGRREANLWKLVNLVEKNAREPGNKLFNLVKLGMNSRGLDEISDGADASSPAEPNKINLMTVHASKGLQFDHVFMPFLDKKPNSTTYQSFILAEDVRRWAIRLPFPDTESFQGGFFEWQVVQDLQERESQESLRVLYVGMTRAKLGLHLSWSGEAKTNSWAQGLSQFVAQGNNSHQYEWQQIEEATEATYKTLSPQVTQREPYQDFIPNTSEINKNQQDSPSMDSSMQSFQQARLKGVILHRVFESLRHHPPHKVLQLCEHWLPGSTAEVAQAIEYLMKLDQPPFAQILQSGHVEWGFRLHSDATHLPQEGRVDLWACVDERLWVVDYKTGSEKYRDKAFLQMENYADVLVRYLNWSGPVSLCALYPFAHKSYCQSHRR
jgi:ATP-dependent helicase/nuclease subunit A